VHLLGRQNRILAFTFPAVVPNQHFIRLQIGMLHGTMTAIGSSHEFCSRADYVLLAVSPLLLKLIIRALKLTEFCLSLVEFLAERIIYFLGVSQLLLKLFIRALKLTEFCLSLGELLAHVLKGTGLSNDFLIGFYIRFFVVVDPILGLLTILQLQLICALNVIADKNIVIIALEIKAS
jgi:hypothetical protein